MSAESVDASLAELRDPNSSQRGVAASRLGELGDPRAVDALAAIVRDRAEELYTRRMAALSLRKFERRLTLPTWSEVARRPDDDEYFRVLAMMELRDADDPTATELLEEIWNRPDDAPRVRAEAARMLGVHDVMALTVGHKAYEYTQDKGYQTYEHVRGYATFQLPVMTRPATGIARPDVTCPVCQARIPLWIVSEPVRRTWLAVVGLAIAACIVGALVILAGADFEFEQFRSGGPFAGLVGLGALAFGLVILGAWVADVRSWVWGAKHRVM